MKAKNSNKIPLIITFLHICSPGSAEEYIVSNAIFNDLAAHDILRKDDVRVPKQSDSFSVYQLDIPIWNIILRSFRFETGGMVNGLSHENRYSTI